MKTTYLTCDNKSFDDQANASNHEDELFEAWLEALIYGHVLPSLADLVRHFSESPGLTGDATEYYGSPWEVLKEMLRAYWDEKNCFGIVK